MIGKLVLLAFALVIPACGKDGKTGFDYECQSTCMDADGNDTQGYESYTIEALDAEQAVEMCVDMAEGEPEVACGPGRFTSGDCRCALASD